MNDIYSYNSNLDFACREASKEISELVFSVLIEGKKYTAKQIDNAVCEIIKRNIIGNNVNFTIVNQ